MVADQFVACWPRSFYLCKKINKQRSSKYENFLRLLIALSLSTSSVLAKTPQQWRRERPDLPVDDAALIGLMVGVAANYADYGLQLLKSVKLTQAEHDVMACLRRQGVPYTGTPSLLLEEVKITSGALTTCVNRLIARGYLKRKHNHEDARSRLLELTAEGKAIIDDVTAHRFKQSATLLDEFSQQEKDNLKKLLMQLQNSLADNQT